MHWLPRGASPEWLPSDDDDGEEGAGKPRGQRRKDDAAEEKDFSWAAPVLSPGVSPPSPVARDVGCRMHYRFICQCSGLQSFPVQFHRVMEMVSFIRRCQLPNFFHFLCI